MCVCKLELERVREHGFSEAVYNIEQPLCYYRDKMD